MSGVEEKLDSSTSNLAETSVDSDNVKELLRKSDFLIHVNNEIFGLITNPDLSETNNDIDYERPLGRSLNNKMFIFEEGHNLHSLNLLYSQIDRQMIRKQRLLRIMATISSLAPSERLNSSLPLIRRHLRIVNKSIDEITKNINDNVRLV